MRQNQRAALDALFSGREYTAPSIYTRQVGEFWPTVGSAGFYLPTIYSYGSHYPLLILTPERNEAYLNTTKYSATTSSQQSGCALYLHYEGYRATGNTVEHRGHVFNVYTRDEPESWPDYPYQPRNSVFNRPAHHASGGE
jgi:hypothetical protein